MTDEQYDIAKKRVKDVAMAIKTTITPNWRLHYIFSRDQNEDDINTTAITTPLWQYKKATMTFYLPALMMLENEEIVETVLHEFVHIILAATQDLTRCEKEYREIVEMTTTDMTAAMFNMLEARDYMTELMREEFNDDNSKKES